MDRSVNMHKYVRTACVSSAHIRSWKPVEDEELQHCFEADQSVSRPRSNVLGVSIDGFDFTYVYIYLLQSFYMAAVVTEHVNKHLSSTLGN